MITYIPAREWHLPTQKPKDGEEVLAWGNFSVDGDKVPPTMEIVTYDSRDKTWNIADDHFTEFNVFYWTELPHYPYPDRSRNK